MSRHRNIRSMNYTDEYDGYDDVYGHSVEDDYCISPSDAAFMYDREGTKNQPTRIGAFLTTENDIAEEEEGESSTQEYVSSLPAADRTKLETCLNDMRITLGPRVSKERMIQVAQSHNFNPEKSINYLLDLQAQEPIETSKKERESAIVKKFTMPKLNLAGHPSKTTNPSKVNSTNSINSYNEIQVLQNICNNVSSINISKDNDSTSTIIPVKELEVMNIQAAIPSWNIDFTAAIKKKKIVLPVKRIAAISNENTKFTPGFIDCDPSVNLETSYFVDRAKLNSKTSYKFKRMSVFGKALCTRYKRKVPYLFHNNDPRKVNRLEKFQFDTISPDDQISGHLRRK